MSTLVTAILLSITVVGLAVILLPKPNLKISKSFGFINEKKFQEGGVCEKVEQT